MNIISELIPIKKQKNHIENIKETIHGPIISDLINTNNKCVSYCSISLEKLMFLFFV